MAQFVRIIIKILKDIIPDVAMPFLNDISVKESFINYR